MPPRPGASPRERLHQRRQHGHQAASARVDHARTAQDLQPVRCLGERRAGALVGGAGHGAAVAVDVTGRVGGGRGDGEDRALDGVRHGLPGGVGRVPQGEPEAPPVGVRRGVVAGQHLGHATQQLGEDRPGVPSRADQRAVRHRAYRVGQGGAGIRSIGVRTAGICTAGLVTREHRLHGRGRRLQRQVEIGAGVAVRHGIDVDRVDLLAGPSERVERETAPGTHRESIERLRHLRHLRLLELLDVARSVDGGPPPAGGGPQAAP